MSIGAGLVAFWAGLVDCGAGLLDFGAGLVDFGASLIDVGAGLVDFGVGLVYIGAALAYVWAGLVSFAGHAMRLGLVVLLGFVNDSLGAPHQSSQTYRLLWGTPNPTLLLL